MERWITFEEYADNVVEILDRVERHGERFIVEEEGRIVAKLGYPNDERFITWKAFVHLYFALPRPDPGFFSDLEEIQATQGDARIPEWPD